MEDNAEKIRRKIHFLTDLIESATARGHNEKNHHTTPIHGKPYKQGSSSARTSTTTGHNQSSEKYSLIQKTVPVRNVYPTSNDGTSQYKWKRSSSDPDLKSFASRKQEMTVPSKLAGGFNDSFHCQCKKKALQMKQTAPQSFTAVTRQLQKPVKDSGKHIIVHRGRSTVNSACLELQERMDSTKREIELLKKKISERSKSLSPSKPPKYTSTQHKSIATSTSTETSSIAISNVKSAPTAKSQAFVSLSKYKLEKQGARAIKPAQADLLALPTLKTGVKQVVGSSNVQPSSPGLFHNHQPEDCAKHQSVKQNRGNKSSSVIMTCSRSDRRQVKSVTPYLDQIKSVPGSSAQFTTHLKPSAQKTPAKFIRKSKYSIVRIKTPAANDRINSSLTSNTKKRRASIKTQNKMPAKFISLSKYSLRRVRRSLSDENKSKLSDPKSLSSPLLQKAKVIRTKYKMMKVSQDPVRVHPDQTYTSHLPPLSYQNSYRGHSRQLYGGQKGQNSKFSAHRYGAYRKKTRYNDRLFHSAWHNQRYQLSYFSQVQRHSRTRKTARHRRTVERNIASLKQHVPFNPQHKLDRRGSPVKPSESHYVWVGSKTTERAGLGSTIAPGSQSSTQQYWHATRATDSGGRNVPSSSRYRWVQPGGADRPVSTVSQLAASQVIRRSVARVAAKHRKVNNRQSARKYCMFYNRFGKCNKRDSCPYVHDPDRVAICTRFLRGTCKVTDCPFSHKVSKEKMPVCSYFLAGVCSRDNCPYLHVNVSRDAEICDDFLAGFCASGEQCKKKHIVDCPAFSRTGVCSDSDKCKLKHRVTAKRKTDRLSDSGALLKKIKVEPVEDLLSSQNAPARADATFSTADDMADDSSVPFKDRRLPAYISLKIGPGFTPGLGIAPGQTRPVIVIDEEEESADQPSMKIRPQF